MPGRRQPAEKKNQLERAGHKGKKKKKDTRRSGPNEKQKSLGQKSASQKKKKKAPPQRGKSGQLSGVPPGRKN